MTSHQVAFKICTLANLTDQSNIDQLLTYEDINIEKKWNISRLKGSLNNERSFY